MSGVRRGRADDAPRMADRAALKREQYKGHAPTFHRPEAGSIGIHAEFLATQIEDEEKHVALVHEDDAGRIDGFLFAVVVPAPPVYHPGGLTCLIDDFMVVSPDLWASVGRELLNEAVRLDCRPLELCGYAP